MSDTVVVNKWKEEFDVDIQRPTKWGNPFSHLKRSVAEFKTKDLQETYDRYREYIEKKCQDPEFLEELKELKGKRLGCCGKELCHGKILIEMIEKYL